MTQRFMRAFDTYYNPDDVSLHPLWLGTLILLCVIIILGTLCCLRIKYGSLWSKLFNRSFRRNIEKHDNNSNDGKHVTMSHAYNWSPIHIPLENESPKFYSLIQNIHINTFDKHLPIKQQHKDEDNDDSNQYSPDESDYHQVSVLPSMHDTRTCEIARKFYASMRNTSQHPNSSSYDSYNSDLSLTSNHSPSITIHSSKFKREASIKLWRTPCFFQSIPYTDGLALGL
ncbi:unnamed protein product [Rotaria sp. Silwood1]|nr:unnamed protein product [Rotaria sp. Silwood1]CAF1288810.1 unnamed protein product [Rotaria sp. Silwood1]CAF3529518.1 unnamed protein product [Rotaria sp. Silwood1]CAF4640402.1 unnamed protein product [Rotaria sp. Silwood1]CAF4662840.1 unnamed protein product [Rotaria sp. Silwood1]